MKIVVKDISSLHIGMNVINEGPLTDSTLCMCVSRCVLCTLPVVPGAVRHPPVPPGDLAGTVHQPGRSQRLEDCLPVIWRYTYAFTLCH